MEPEGKWVTALMIAAQVFAALPEHEKIFIMSRGGNEHSRYDLIKVEIRAIASSLLEEDFWKED